MATETETKEIKVHVVGGPEDGKDPTFRVPAGTTVPCRVKVDGVEYRLVPGKHKFTQDDGAVAMSVTLAIHPHAVRLYAEPA